ncbi:MAG: hypothetical protein K2X38_00215 [Gemmataceae bacterium]|nr:hypothetical protein [Gemmataceae bacterium]
MLALRYQIDDDEAKFLQRLLANVIILPAMRPYLHLLPKESLRLLLDFLAGGSFEVDVTFRREPAQVSSN